MCGFTTVKQDYSLITLSYASITDPHDSRSPVLQQSGSRTWMRHWQHKAADLFNTDQCFSRRRAAHATDVMSYLISTNVTNARLLLNVRLMSDCSISWVFILSASLSQDSITAHLKSHTLYEWAHLTNATGFHHVNDNVCALNKPSQKPVHIRERSVMASTVFTDIHCVHSSL